MFESPQLMKRCIDTLLQSKLKTKSQILYEIPFPRTMVESLLYLPEGYLTDEYGELRHFQTVKNDAGETRFSGGKLVNFSDRDRN